MVILTIPRELELVLAHCHDQKDLKAEAFTGWGWNMHVVDMQAEIYSEDKLAFPKTGRRILM